MPLNLSATHLLVVAVVALVVLGPDKLPEAARTAAHWIGRAREELGRVQAETRESFGEYLEPVTELVQAVQGVRGGIANAAATAAGWVTSAPPAAGAMPAADTWAPAGSPGAPGSPSPVTTAGAAPNRPGVRTVASLDPVGLPLLAPGSGLASPGPPPEPLPELRPGWVPAPGTWSPGPPDF